MAFFNFRKKKNNNNKKSSRLVLRKTKSMGNIADENQILARQTTSTTAPVTDQLQLGKTNNSDKQQQSPVAAKVGGSTPNSIAEDYVTGSSSSEDESSDDDNDSSTDSSDTDSVSSLPTSSILKNYNTQLQQQQNQQRPQHMIIPRVQLKSSSTPSTPRETERSSYFSSGDLELLLSMETQARIDAQEKAAAEAAAAPPPPPRKTALRFELPVTPSRSRSPNPAYSAYSRPRQRWSLPDEKWLDNDNKKKKNGKKQSSKKSKKGSKSWKNRIMGSDDDEGKNKSDSDDEEQERILKVGDKVYLLHRPLPIFGYVRYMGTVNFESGDNWVGVELESRVGKNDGSVNGQRYFHTDPHRGTFVRKSELGFA